MPVLTREARRNPVGLVILATGAAAALATGSWSMLAPWSDRAVWVGLLSAAAYAGTVVVYAWPRPEPPELRAARQLRDALAEQIAAHGGAPTFTLRQLLTEAVVRLDREVIPTLAELIVRNRSLQADISRFRRGDLVAPDASALERLQAIEARQRRTIDSAVRQIANAYAAALVLGQQSASEGRLVSHAQELSRQLQDTHAELAELLDESGSWERRLQEREHGHAQRRA